MKQKQTKKLSLRSWLSISFIGLILILLSGLWLLQTVFLDDTYKFIKTIQIKDCAKSISSHLNNEDVDELMSMIKDQNDMAVTLYDVSSSIYSPLYTNEPSITGIRSYLNMSDVYKYYTQAKENGGSIVITQDSGYRGKIKPQFEFDANFFDEFFDKSATNSEVSEPNFERHKSQSMAYVLLDNVDSPKYLIIVESEITPVSSVVYTIRIQLIIVTIIMLIICSLVSLFLAKAISSPIKKTNENAKELAKQNYNITFSNSSYKEISELNDTLNFTANELGKVDTLRKDLISNVSHDLRTPLTMITGYAEVMRDLPGENTPENLQIIIDESNRLSRLVTDILDLSKLEAGTINIETNYFSITDCIKSILTRYSKLTEQDGYNIEFNYKDNVYIEADELKISQVIYNLINNAINYIGKDKTVIINQTVENGFVRIDIIDHGEGIPEDKLQYIWDRYYKVDKTHKRAVIGTGLGLSIVKNILENHNAQYGVDSQIDIGSDFYFLLPIHNEEK